MIRSEIRALVRKNLGETTAAFWSDVELNSYINLAGHDIADKAKCIRTNSYITTVASQMDYQMSTLLSYCISVLEVYLYREGATWEKLDAITRRELDERYAGWLSWAAGTPTMYQSDIEEDILRIITKPSTTNAGTNYLRVFYAQDFVELTADSETPDLTADLQLAMVDFVVAFGYQQRGWNEKSNNAMNMYIGRIKNYMIERNRQKEDEELIMKNYRNI